MSADNYLILRREGRWYVLYSGFASYDFERELGGWTKLEEALSIAQELQHDYEYGLTLDLGGCS